MKPRRKTALERRRRLVAEMYLKGLAQSEIAVELRISQATVSREIDALKRDWRDLSRADLNEFHARELRKIELIEREAWEAWKRSQAPGEGESSADKGDPRFLELVNKCIAQRASLLGFPARGPEREGQSDDSVSLEIRRERIHSLCIELRDRERIGRAGAGAGDGQPGSARGPDEPGKMEAGAPPGVARPDAPGGN
jgi:hypothetical protein